MIHGRGGPVIIHLFYNERYAHIIILYITYYINISRMYIMTCMYLYWAYDIAYVHSAY